MAGNADPVAPDPLSSGAYESSSLPLDEPSGPLPVDALSAPIPPPPKVPVFKRPLDSLDVLAPTERAPEKPVSKRHHHSNKERYFWISVAVVALSAGMLARATYARKQPIEPIRPALDELTLAKGVGSAAPAPAFDDLQNKEFAAEPDSSVPNLLPSDLTVRPADPFLQIPSNTRAAPAPTQGKTFRGHDVGSLLDKRR